jgi:hypothetical protein
MTGISLEERVLTLERQVSELATRDDVRALGEQILHLGAEMRDGLFAIREEVRAGDEETRRCLREEIRAGDEENRRFMRMLYEDVIDRLGRLRG